MPLLWRDKLPRVRMSVMRSWFSAGVSSELNARSTSLIVNATPFGPDYLPYPAALNMQLQFFLQVRSPRTLRALSRWMAESHRVVKRTTKTTSVKLPLTYDAAIIRHGVRSAVWVASHRNSASCPLLG
jgi:hypothetical protein